MVIEFPFSKRSSGDRVDEPTPMVPPNWRRTALSGEETSGMRKLCAPKLGDPALEMRLLDGIAGQRESVGIRD